MTRPVGMDLRGLAPLVALVTLASLACQGTLGVPVSPSPPTASQPAAPASVVPVSRPTESPAAATRPAAEARRGSTSATAQPDTVASPRSPRTGRDPGFRRRSPFVPLDNPVLLTAEEASYLADDELVLGLEWKGSARAYPIGMVTFHHIVNDTVEGTPLLITY